MLYNLVSATYMPNFKEIHQYLVPQSSKSLQELCIPKFSITFVECFRQSTKMKMVSLNSHWNAESIKPQFYSKQPTLKFDLILLDLDLTST